MRYVLSFCFLLPLILSAQYSTPGTGVHWNLDSLVLHSGGVVTPNLSDYHINENLTISENDSLTVLTYGMYFAPDVLFTIEGYTSIGGFGPILESIESQQPYEGIRIEETGEAVFDYARFNGGGGVKCISGNVQFMHCEFMEVEHIATNNAAVELFTGEVLFQDCLFQSCLGSAISSPANIACGVEVMNSVFIGNNTENTNRPQINLGPSGQDYQIFISDCVIEGNPSLEMAGGIAISSLFGDPSSVSVTDNIIRDNRYGIAINGGGIWAYVFDNIIEDNDTQNEPFLGGSGINLNGPASNQAFLQGNEIRGNLWGVTVQGEFNVNMGDGVPFDGSLGNNIFSENGNGGQTYALFNNTPNTIFAQNNCWIEGQVSTAAEIEDVISHQVDDAELGLVDFSDYLCGIVGLDEISASSISIYPNPCSEHLYFEAQTEKPITAIEILDVQGRSCGGASKLSDERYISVAELPSGVYLLRAIIGDSAFQTSFIKK